MTPTPYELREMKNLVTMRRLCPSRAHEAYLYLELRGWDTPTTEQLDEAAERLAVWTPKTDWKAAEEPEAVLLPLFKRSPG